MCIVGCNPRQSATITNCTDKLPQCTKLLSLFVQQLQPDFSFACVSLRSNCCREPHRDTRNVGNSLVYRLTQHAWGGHLWIASPEGLSRREFQGQQVTGRIQRIDEPFVFSARSHLHATEDWPPLEERVVLVAFTPLKSLASQHQLQHPKNPHNRCIKASSPPTFRGPHNNSTEKPSRNN